MKHIIVGLGSIGQRHYANLKRLRPDDEIITVDVNGEADILFPINFSQSIIKDSIAYICTPTELHLDQYKMMIFGDAKAVFVEKPLCSINQKPFIDFPHRPFSVGYCYRYHPLFRELKSRANEVILMRLFGSDNLSAKYGPTAMETMLSHSIDMALWLFGEARSFETINDGDWASCNIQHKKTISRLQANMFTLTRMASCFVRHANGEEYHEILRSGQMYIDEMSAWLNYVETGDAGDLCTLEQAIQVQKVMHG